LWGHLKTVVYSKPPTDLIDLKQKIINLLKGKFQ